MNMNRLTAISVAAASVFTAAPASAKEIVVVQVAAVPGAQAQSGKAIRAGIRLYVNHINESGVLGADKIKFVSYDDAYKADETVRLVKESIAKDSPMAFVGVLGTANNEAIIKDGVLAKANIPLVRAIS